MSRKYTTYVLDCEEDGLRCTSTGEHPTDDFIVPWPASLSGLEEPDYSAVKDQLTEGILHELNDRGLILVGDFPALMHAVYVMIAPGGGTVHPGTFEVYEAESLNPYAQAQEIRIARSDARRERYMTEVGRLDRIDRLADRMLLEARYADVPATEVWDMATSIIDSNGRQV